MALRDHLRTLRYATWLGWQVESNWTSPLLFIIYSLVKPIAAVLILVFMYLIILGDVASDPVFFSFMFIGNALYLFVAQVLFGLTWVLHEDREHFQTLRNIYMAPMSFYMYVVGRALSKIIITSAAVFITLLFGVVALDVPIDLLLIDWPYLLIAMVIGLIMICALGVALAGVSMLTAKHSGGINEAIAGVFYLFCGVIFPVTILPVQIQGVSLAIPVTYWLEILRRSLVPGIGIEGISGLSAFSNIELVLLLLVSAALFLVISLMIFRYADYRARKQGKLDMITTY
jgi:ABC-2 type transport system permease protein